MFGVVEFLNDSVNVVPMCWLKGDRCYWPNEENPSELAKQMMNPNEDWPLYKVKTITFANLATFEEARKSLKKPRAEPAKQPSRKTKGGQTSQNSSFTEATDGGSCVPSDDSVPKNEEDELEDEMSNLNVSSRSDTFEEARESLKKPRAEPAKQPSRKTKGGQTSQNSSFTEATDGGSRVPSDYSVPKNEEDELEDEMSNLNVSGRSEKHQSGEESISKSMEDLESLEYLESLEAELLKEPELREDNSETENEDGVLNDILKKVSLVRVLRELDKKVDALCVMLGVNKDGIYFAVNLPLKNMTHLMLLENYLTSEIVKDYLCEKLSKIEGSDFTRTVGKMLMKLMTNELAMGFTWCRTKNKDTTQKYYFSKLNNIKSTLYRAVKERESFSNKTDGDIKYVISNWLSNAKKRSESKK